MIVLVTFGRPTGGQLHPTWQLWALACGAGTLVVVALLRISRDRRSRDRALLLGVAGGTAFAYVALLTKGVADRLANGGVGGVVTTGELYGLVAAAVAALTLQQMSFSAGAVHQAVPASTVTTPVISLVLGVTVLGEWFNVDGPGWVLLGGTLAVMAVATVLLAHKEVSTAGPGSEAGAAGEAASTGGPGSDVDKAATTGTPGDRSGGDIDDELDDDPVAEQGEEQGEPLGEPLGGRPID